MSEEIQQLTKALHTCCQLRDVFLRDSFQMPLMNPMDANVPKKIDGLTPPYDPFAQPLLPKSESLSYQMVNGIFVVYDTEGEATPDGKPCARRSPSCRRLINEILCLLGELWHPLSLSSFYKCLNFVMEVTCDGPIKSYCYRRLQFLSSKFSFVPLCLIFGFGAVLMARYRLHTQLNDGEEKASCKVLCSLFLVWF